MHIHTYIYIYIHIHTLIQTYTQCISECVRVHVVCASARVRIGACEVSPRAQSCEGSFEVQSYIISLHDHVNFFKKKQFKIQFFFKKKL